MYAKRVIDTSYSLYKKFENKVTESHTWVYDELQIVFTWKK